MCGTSRFDCGFPLAASGATLIEALARALRRGACRGADRVLDRQRDRRARRPARAEAVAGSPQPHRRRVRQGRRRQVDGGRELRARVGGRGRDASACSTPISTARASRACWASSGQRPETRDGKMLEPLVAHGIEAMSIGFLVDEQQPMAWRGPMVTSALNQLLTQTRWGDLDYLIVDMPPGTGDIQLTLAQRVPVSGAVIVTTPQDIALADARKGLEMFQKVHVPVLGVVENMSLHICSHCGHEERHLRRARRAQLERAVRRAAARLAAARPAHPRGDRSTASPRSLRIRRARSRARSREAALRAVGRARRARQGLQPPVSEHHRRGQLMSVKSDRWIRRMAAERKMIEPFEADQVRASRRQSRHLVRHVELRLRRALRARVQGLHEHQLGDRRPEEVRRVELRRHGRRRLHHPAELVRAGAHRRVLPDPAQRARRFASASRRMRAAASSST